MNIKYDFVDEEFIYNQEDEEEIEKLNFILTNNKGDFLNLGAKQNSCKFQGLNVCNSKTLEIFKFLDEIILEGLNVESVEYGGYYVFREYTSKVSSVMRIPVSDTTRKAIDTLGDEGKLVYNSQGILEEVVDEESFIQTQDKYYLGPTGGVVYEVNNYDGKLIIDLDMKKRDDFDIWGREYNVYEKNGIIFVEYTKKREDQEEYKLYLGVRAVNFSYNFIKDFIKKDYSYSRQRGSGSERYVYRLMEVEISQSKRLVFGAGFSEDEVSEQISLLELHQNELEGFDEQIFKDLVKKVDFKKPITQDVLVAYQLSNNAVYRFLNKDLNNDKISMGSFAGFPWFSDVWTRDELVGLRAFINNEEEHHVKSLLYSYLNSVNYQTGMLLRIKKDGALESPDSVFWLAKRFEDFIFYLEKNKRLNAVITQGELELVYDKFNLIFKKLAETLWDKDNELLKVKNGDSWMDTISVNFPVDIQVQFLELVSFLVLLAQLLRKKEDLEHLEDFEILLKNKIRTTYFRGGILYDEPCEDKITCNTFLCYYFYPELFPLSDWEIIFDNAILHLKTVWGGLSSISKKDSRFCESYTGENNLSYHQGDSWFWINNIAAICMSDLNDKKYRREISKILVSSTNDILKMGTMGFGSEISSAAKQKAQGSLAQLWSSSTYLEMVEKLFDRE